MREGLRWAASVPHSFEKTKANATELFAELKSIDFSKLEEVGKDDFWLLNTLNKQDSGLIKEFEKQNKSENFREMILAYLHSSDYQENDVSLRFRMKKHKNRY